jgi:RNA polymerase sigma-70 factor (ECF subfamily)
LNRLRNATNRARLLAEKVEPVEPAGASPSAETRAEVRQILAKVPEELARVAVYYYLDDMTHKEIADHLGCSRRHVGDLLVRFIEAARAVEDQR